jgi:LacI family transcriptional regulator
VIGGQEHSRITQARVNSICENLPESTQVTRLYTDYRYDNAKEKIAAHFSSGTTDYDAIVGVNGAISLAARSVATKWSLTNVDFLSIDDIPNAEDFGLCYPSVVHDYKQWATIVAENLVAAIEERPWQPRTVINGFLKNYR